MNTARKQHVLVVEDDPIVRQTVCNILEREGYTVVAVESAAAALAEMNSSTRFDLVFSDVVMPGVMSGIELIREIQHQWPMTKVLLTSGYPDDRVSLRMSDGVRLVSNPAKFKRPEGVPLLAKPYSNAALKKALAEVLGHSGP